MVFKKMMVILLSSIFLCGFGTAGYIGYKLYSFSEKIQQNAGTDTLTQARSKGDTTEAQMNQASRDETDFLPRWPEEKPVNVLLLGVDKRDGDPGSRSDTMLVLNINPKTKKASLLSILRDSWVQIPGHSKNRINTSYELGGPALAVQAVENLTGLDIPYYITTDFKGFEKIVDDLGGIDLNVEKNMDYVFYEANGYYDIHLKKGPQHLDGRKALQYVRFRHDALGDYTRTERQRNFLKALAQKAQHQFIPIKIPSMLDDVAPYITTNLTMRDMLRLGYLTLQVDWSQMQTQQIPPASILKEINVSGAEVINPRVEKTKEFIQVFLKKHGS